MDDNGDNTPNQTTIPTSILHRGSVAGKTAAKIGLKKITFASQQPFRSKDVASRARLQHEEDIAKLVFGGLTQLRGTALKIAQLLSLETGILSDNYRKELAKSHYRVPPLNRAIIRKVFINEFSKPPEKVFQRFGHEAFAAASLGQVHAASNGSDDNLAVKIQYPGIATSVINDLNFIQRLPIPILKKPLFRHALVEIRGRLNEELDYNLELKNQQWFYKNLKFPNVQVPKPFANLSTKRVLTSEYSNNLHLDDWLATNPSQEVRDKAAQTLFDQFMHCTFELKCLHADPNPGNYLFDKNGNITLIDFGCVKRMSDQRAKNLKEIWTAHVLYEPERILAVMRELGFKTKTNRESQEQTFNRLFTAFNEWMKHPFNNEHFDFKEHPEFCNEGVTAFRQILLDPIIEDFTTDFLFFDRTMLGLFRMFEQMGAKVKLRPDWAYE